MIRTILVCYHLRARIAIKKPYLTARNLLARKLWAKEHALLPKILRQDVLFSDETTLELHPNKRALVRRLPNTGMEKKNLSETRKFGGKKLMLWGFVAHDGQKGLQKSLWNDKFDQKFADFSRKSIAGKHLGRKIATRYRYCIKFDPCKDLIFQKCIRNSLNWPPNSPNVSFIWNV